MGVFQAFLCQKQEYEITLLKMDFLVNFEGEFRKIEVNWQIFQENFMPFLAQHKTRKLLLSQFQFIS